jgi:regulator of replication initiation timing
MYNDEMTKKMMDLFTNPLFKKGFFDFFLKMQQEGIEAARKFWSAYPGRNSLMPDVIDMYERMVDFYIILGFVPKARFDEVVSENKSLKEENSFLRDTIRELQLSLFSEGGEKVQKLWQGIIDKQLETNKEIAKNFFELVRQLRAGAS